MTLRLANDDIFISHGGDTVQLIPSLRAAYNLQVKHGLGKIMKGLDEGSFTIFHDVLAESGNPQDAIGILDTMCMGGLSAAIFQLQGPIFQFLAISFGLPTDPDEEHLAEQNASDGQPFDLHHALVQFFEFGTGWMGWTPAQTWAATPAEIMAAKRGLEAKFRALNGGGKLSTVDSSDRRKLVSAYDPRQEVPESEVRHGINALRANARRGR